MQRNFIKLNCTGRYNANLYTESERIVVHFLQLFSHCGCEKVFSILYFQASLPLGGFCLKDFRTILRLNDYSE